MRSIVDILSIILPVFLALGLGMLCRSRRILTPEGVATLKKVAVNITLPAVSLGTFARADYSAGRMLVPLWIYLACCIALGLGFLARRLLRMKYKLTPYLCTAFEGGMLGFSLYPLIYGDLSPFAIVVMGQTIFIYTLYKVLLAGARGARGLLREAVTSPALWALIIGVIMGSTGLYGRMADSGAQQLFDSVLSFISAPTGFLILLAIGYDLTPAQIQWRKTASLIALRLGVSLIALGGVLLLDRFVLGGMMHTGALLLLFILPPPFVLPVFADVDDERTDISSALSALTVVSILLFAVLAVVF